MDKQRPAEGPDDAEVDRAFREIVAGLRGEGPGVRVNPPLQGEHYGHHEHHDPRVRPERPETATSDPQRPPSDTTNAPSPSPPPSPPRPQSASPSDRPHHLGAGTPEGMATDHRSYEPPEEEEHFVPPPPPPLPAGDLHFWGIVVGLVLGPVLIVLSAVVPALGPIWALAGVLLGVGGFVLLVLRQPRRRGFGGDDGARV